MYTFRQLIIRNALLALVFILTTGCFSIVTLSSLLEEKNNQHIQLVNTITKQLSISHEPHQTAGVIASVLKHSSHYNILTISDSAGEVLINEINNTGLVIPFTLPAPKIINSKGLTITYQLNFARESRLVLNVNLLLLALVSFLIFFAASMSTKRHKKVFNMISNQIKKDFAIVKSHNSKENEPVISENIVEIPELKQGIADIKQLMNQQLENSIHLEKEAYVDQLTQLDNRNRFVQFHEKQIMQDSPVKFGVLVIVRCSELQTINQIHGYNEGDKYICAIGNIIKKVISTYLDGRLFRLNSSDFSCILPNIKLPQAENFTSALTAHFNQYQQASELDSVAYSGLVFFDKTKPLGELLALADTGVSIAQTQSPNAWYSEKETDIFQQNSSHYGNQNWRQEIDSVIENQRVTLLLQPIQPTGRNSKVYSEVLARFLNANDEVLPTTSFIAMSEQLDKITIIDKLIIDTTIKEIINKNMLDHSFGINISARSISDEHFMIWLERKLLREPQIAPRLIFEITEYGLQQNIKTSKRLIDMLHRVGARVTVERFGVGLTSFKFFRELTPDYIKMDSSYTRNIDDDKNNQYFLRLMVDLAHRLSISVLAESVESQEEKHTLEKIFIDGCQGFYIGKPMPL